MFFLSLVDDQCLSLYYPYYSCYHENFFILDIQTIQSLILVCFLQFQFYPPMTIVMLSIQSSYENLFQASGGNPDVLNFSSKAVY